MKKNKSEVDLVEKEKSESVEQNKSVLDAMKKLCAENPGNKLLKESMKMGIEH